MMDQILPKRYGEVVPFLRKNLQLIRAQIPLKFSEEHHDELIKYADSTLSELDVNACIWTQYSMNEREIPLKKNRETLTFIGDMTFEPGKFIDWVWIVVSGKELEMELGKPKLEHEEMCIVVGLLRFFSILLDFFRRARLGLDLSIAWTVSSNPTLEEALSICQSKLKLILEKFPTPEHQVCIPQMDEIISSIRKLPKFDENRSMSLCQIEKCDVLWGFIVSHMTSFDVQLEKPIIHEDLNIANLAVLLNYISKLEFSILVYICKEKNE